MSDAELRALLLDCLSLWAIEGDVTMAGGVAEIGTPAGRFALCRAAPTDRPIRWLLHTPDRAADGRSPRALASIVAALSVLRRAAVY